jgi:hypothetical protein
LISLSLLEGIQHYIPTGHFSCNLFSELHAARIMLFMPTNVTPQKKKWEISLCLSFFTGIRGAAPRDIQEW